MAKSASRSRDHRSAPSARSEPVTDSFERARPWLLAGTAMLFVARPLIPSVNIEHQGNDAPFVMLWLILLALTIALLWRKGEAVVRTELIDLLLLVTIVLYVASALVACWNGAAPRPALNMLWTWIAYGAAFFLIRQLLRTPPEARALAAVMLALAVSSCGYALHEYFVSQPMTVAQYEANPDAALRDAGMWFPPGSRERYLFEQRLHSTEPTATFALTNSLAGFLTPWLVVVAGALAALPSLVPSRRRVLLSLATIGLVMLLALLLTKSRSAVVGLMAGGAMLAVLRPVRRHVFTRRAAAILGVLLVVVVVAIATGGVDAEVLAEAPKSLAYRFEYWRSTWDLIVANPIWGVGPGEFKDAYLAAKLPTASEEISDPHNFLLEIWATAGSAAAAAFVFFLGATIWRSVRATDADGDVLSASSVKDRADPSARTARLIVGGGLAGWVLAFLLPFFAGPVIDVPLTLVALFGGLIVGGGVLVLMWPWIVGGSLPRLVPLAGLMALGVNLLAAGGIGHPGVAGSLFLLAALATTNFGGATPSCAAAGVRRVGAKPLAVGTCVALVLAAAAALTFYHPVVTSQLAIAAAQQQPQLAEESLVEAIADDPFGFDAPRRMAQLRYEQWQAQPTELTRKTFVAAAELWLARRPQSSEAWSQVGGWHLAIFERTAERTSAEAAVAACRRAVEYYPNNCVRHARLALAASAAGDATTARAEAAEALRLDTLMPHAEQRLDENVREQMKRLAPEMPSGT